MLGSRNLLPLKHPPLPSSALGPSSSLPPPSQHAPTPSVNPNSSPLPQSRISRDLRYCNLTLETSNLPPLKHPSPAPSSSLPHPSQHAPAYTFRQPQFFTSATVSHLPGLALFHITFTKNLPLGSTWCVEANYSSPPHTIYRLVTPGDLNSIPMTHHRGIPSVKGEVHIWNIIPTLKISLRCIVV